MFLRSPNCSALAKLFLIVGMLALLLATAGFPTRVNAFSVTITVFTAADNTTEDGLCSLREALLNANNNDLTSNDCSKGTGSEIINFASSLGTIVLTSPLPPISDTSGLKIVGGGKITISGNDLFQVFYLNANVPLTLDGLTVAHGLSTDGGGVYAGPGSQLTILNSTFSNNKAISPGNTGLGGGVDNHGTVVINNSSFSANSADGSGGGLFNSAGTLSLANTTFSGNSSGYGGGLRNLSGSISVVNSTFSGNNASSDGGAIYHYGGTLSVTGSTFSTNAAGVGGAISNIANLSVANSTFFNNSANIGGAISSSYIGPLVGSTTILSSTFSGNTAILSGFGVVYNQALLTLSNSIIANSGIGSGDCVGTVSATSRNNLFEDAADTCGLSNGINGNITGTDPKLGPGSGSPVYLPLNDGSAAINAGNDTQCAAAPVNNTSQNGRSRPDGAHCDIGAYEADVTPPMVVSVVRANPNPTALAAVSFTVTFSEPVYSVSLNDFALTKTGVTGGSVVSISGTSGTTITVTVNTGSGSGTMRLDVLDRDTILDTANLYLGGTGLGNGSFITGEAYDIQKGGPTALPSTTPTNPATSTPVPTPTPFHAFLPQILR
jgi:CSLREA domain-containing protein